MVAFPRPGSLPNLPRDAMNSAAAITPMPRRMRATCPNCGQALDPWNTCPGVSAEVAAAISTVQRPVYCDRKEGPDAYAA